MEASRKCRLIWWWFWTYFVVNMFDTKLFSHYPRPVLAFGYCRCLRLCVCVCLSVCQSLACPCDNSGPVQATRYLMSWHGISKHQYTWEFRRNCREDYGIVTWRTIYSNAKWYSFRSILLGRPVYFLWMVLLVCLQSDSASPSDERWHSQQHWALAGRTADVADCMWPASPRE